MFVENNYNPYNFEVSMINIPMFFFLIIVYLFYLICVLIFLYIYWKYTIIIILGVIYYSLMIEDSNNTVNLFYNIIFIFVYHILIKNLFNV